MYGLYGKSDLGIVGYAIGQRSTSRHGHGDFQLSPRTSADRHGPWTETHHEYLKREVRPKIAPVFLKSPTVLREKCFGKIGRREENYVE
jgi:hypothetical protein